MIIIPIAGVVVIAGIVLAWWTYRIGRWGPKSHDLNKVPTHGVDTPRVDMATTIGMSTPQGARGENFGDL